jgi:hypothetical protein
VKGTFWGRAAFAALVLVAATSTACSKKNDYSADSSAAGVAADTMGMSASSTAPAMQDTATMAAAPSPSKTKKSTVKKTAPKKTTY